MDFYLAHPVDPFAPDLAVAMASFTTKKSIDALPVSVIPAGSLKRGKMIWMKARGEFSTTATPTLQLGFWIGTRALAISADLALSAAITTGSGAAAWPWEMAYEGKVTAEGVTGSITGSGTLRLGSSLTAFAADVPIPVTAAARTVAVDTTIERAIGVSGAWGTSSASNSVRVHLFGALILN